jgi:hypothetical protein
MSWSDVNGKFAATHLGLSQQSAELMGPKQYHPKRDRRFERALAGTNRPEGEIGQGCR